MARKGPASNQFEKELSCWGRHSLASSGTFFVLFGLYVWLFLDPKLIYHAFGIFMRLPAFRADWGFFKQHLNEPGGPVEYISALLSQGYYYSWLGAVIITSVAWLIWAGTRRLICRAGEPRASFLGYVPVMLLLATHNRYLHLMTMSLALLTALWLSVAYEKLANSRLRASLFLAICCFSYFVAGYASLLFAVLVAIYEGFTRHRPFLGGLYLLLGLAVPTVLGTYVFDLPLPDAWVHSWPSDFVIWSTQQKILILSLCIFIPLVAIGVSLWKGLVHGRLSRRGAKPARRAKLGRALGLTAQTAGPILVAILTISLSFAADWKTHCRVAYFYRQKMWSQLLQMVRRLPTGLYDKPSVNHEIGRALYHTGRLGDDLFFFPQALQRVEAFFLTGKTRTIMFRLMKKCDFMLELGAINAAERLGYESMENNGASPFILQKLALINIVKGQTETARIFLNAQSKDLVYGAQAREILRRLDKDPQLDGDEQVQHLRSLMLVEDYIPGDELAETLLLKLLERNPSNRMAFEYLMASYLLTRQLGKVVQNIKRLDDFDYKEIPRHYQEAVLIHERMAGRKANLGERRISAATRLRFKEFTGVWKQHGGQIEAARPYLAAEFGHSYFFYYLFGRSGV